MKMTAKQIMGIIRGISGNQACVMVKQSGLIVNGGMCRFPDQKFVVSNADVFSSKWRALTGRELLETTGDHIVPIGCWSFEWARWKACRWMVKCKPRSIVQWICEASIHISENVALMHWRHLNKKWLIEHKAQVRADELFCAWKIMEENKSEWFLKEQ